MKKLITLILILSLTICMVACGDDNENNNVVADKYKIVISCQTEMGEEEVLKVLKKKYEELHEDVEVEVKTFSGEGFEQYMYGISAQQSSSPNIIWTCDSLHSQWDEYFTDLRPFYESSPETDYSLYYETMLDAASTNGHFKPTKNYKGSFRSDDLDLNSDGYESYENHSEHGIYYAPRDFNKPAILCNTHLFKELDENYESVYKIRYAYDNGGSADEVSMPADYVSTYDRLQGIVNGEDWDELNDLFVFSKLIAERIVFIVNNVELTNDRNLGRKWNERAVLNLFLDWEPTYTTILNYLGFDLINSDGSLNLSKNKDKLKALHDSLFPSGNDYLDQVSSYMTTTNTGVSFSKGSLFMTVCSRPVVLGYGNTFRGSYGETCLETIKIPVDDIAAGNSGYAISSIWEGKGMTVNGVYKSYTELSWDFIKFIITEVGQEVAGETGLNIPVLKKLYSAETNGGVVPAWRKVESLGDMHHDAWVEGGELRQEIYNIFVSMRRAGYRSTLQTFFLNLQKTNYNYGSLDELISTTERYYNLNNPSRDLRKANN